MKNGASWKLCLFFCIFSSLLKNSVRDPHQRCKQSQQRLFQEFSNVPFVRGISLHLATPYLFLVFQKEPGPFIILFKNEFQRHLCNQNYSLAWLLSFCVRFFYTLVRSFSSCTWRPQAPPKWPVHIYYYKLDHKKR